MKSVANVIRKCIPFMNDEQIFGMLSFFHGFILLIPAILFLVVKNIAFRISILYVVLCIILSELVFEECPLRFLEAEFSDREMPNLLEVFYDWWGWKNRSREQQVSSFISFNIGLFLSLVGFTIFDYFRG
jgi:hypothetical protein